MKSKISWYRHATSLVACAALSVASLNAQGKDTDGYGFFIGYSYDGVAVNNMPFSIRNVPVHSDDSWAASGQGPINETHYSANHGAELGFGYTWNGSVGDTVRTKAGLGLKWMIFPAGYGADKEERNYMGAVGTSQRGYGTALTFVSFGRYGAAPSFHPGLDMLLTWTPCLKFELGPKKGVFRDFTVGVEGSYCEYRAVNGWDRYDKLEQNDAEVLSRCFPIRLYLGYWSPTDDFVVRVGAQFQPMIMTDLGRQADMESPGVTGFITFGFGF